MQLTLLFFVFFIFVQSQYSLEERVLLPHELVDQHIGSAAFGPKAAEVLPNQSLQTRLYFLVIELLLKFLNELGGNLKVSLDSRV